MNPFKKFNTYLLENHPLMWHSKVVSLTLAGIFIWIVSYFVGYAMVDIHVLQSESIIGYYFESYYIFFHILFCIIIIFLWAFFFYKNNAFKHYYPLEKAYFRKLFFLLFFPFLLILSAYYPFTFGCKAKTSTFFNEKELKQDIDELNLGYAFLMNDPYNYKLENRVYPNPYPVDFIKFDENDRSWGRTSAFIKNKEKNRYVNYDLYGDLDKNTVVVKGIKYKFFTTNMIKIDPKNKYQSPVITKFYKERELDHPSEYSLFNFSTTLINTDLDQYKTTFHFYDDNFSLFNFNNESDNGLNYKKLYAHKIYQLVKSKNYSQILNSIDRFKEICEKYGVEHRINSNHFLRYLRYQKFENLENSILKEYDEYDYVISKNSASNQINKIQSYFNQKEKFIKAMNQQRVYFVYSSDLRTMINNFKKIKTSVLSNYSIIPILFVVLGLVWLFLFFEFTTIKNFIITIPIAGVLIIVNFITIINVQTYRNIDKMILSSFLITFGVILLLLFLAIKTKKFRKSILTILINLSYCIAPILFIFMTLLYNEWTKRIVRIGADGWPHEKTIDSFLLNPYIFFLFSITGILIFYSILRKWKAYEE